jgi:SNF2 family DNA or RNA helicase
LSGTPVANKPDDLWSQFYFLDDGETLGTTLAEFRKRYRSEGGGYAALDDLRDRVDRISKRRLKEHAVALPAKRISRLRLKMAGRQRELYDEMRNELAIWVESLEGNQVLHQAEAILARLVRLAQLASDPSMLDASYDEEPCKFVALDALLDEALSRPDARKVIVWSSFVANIASVERRYARYNPVSLHGALTNEQRDASVRAFKQNSNVKLMVANPAAAREGLTLTEANLAIYLDRTFNLVDYLQSQDRIHRLSQTSDCQIVLLLAKDSIDEFVDFCLEQKTRLARFVQQDVNDILPADAALEKPDILRALLWPEDGSP